MPSVSLIIPIFNLNADRLENFQHVLGKIANIGIPIYIVEQNTSKNNYKDFNHLNLFFNDNNIHKSALINHASRMITTEYMWMLDADCVLRFNEVLDNVKGQDVIQPFRYIVLLNELETKSFIKNNHLKIPQGKRVITKKFGPCSFIIKKDVFEKIGGMNESFAGHGWEDMEFAHRVKSNLYVDKLDLTGLHLYHKKSIGRASNKTLYLSLISRQITNIRSKINVEELSLVEKSSVEKQNVNDFFLNDDLATEKINVEKLALEEKRSDKKKSEKRIKDKVKIKSEPNEKHPDFIGNLINLTKQASHVKKKNVEIINDSFVEKPLENTVKNKIIHLIAPALLQNKPELLKRELLAIESVIQCKRQSNVEVMNILFSSNTEALKYEGDFKVIVPQRTAQDIGDKRDLTYLSDMFETMYGFADDETMMFYTNSDCCIGYDTYCKLLKYDKHAIEYHRNDVVGSPETLECMFSNPSSIHNRGIDGLALTRQFYETNKKYIADFFVGEPHWDTAVGGFLRNFNLSILNTDDLYHPKHDITWDTSKLTIAGKHNTDLYREYLEYGFLKSHVLELPRHYNIPDTSVVIVHFGNDRERVEATSMALSWLAIQELPVEYVFVELVYDNAEGAFEYLKGKKGFNYIKVVGDESNKVLWQKEAMMNIGARVATGQYVIFLDSDIYSRHSNWFNRIRQYLVENPNTLLQVFRLCADSKYSDQMFVSMAAKHNDFDVDLPHNPGLGIAVRKEILVANNYLNPYCLYGSGDTCILAEYCNQDGYLFHFEKLHAIRRNPGKICDMNYIDEDVTHVNHGKIISLDYYRDRHEVTKKFTKSIRELVTVDGNGLLAWNDGDCMEKQLIVELYKKKFG